MTTEQPIRKTGMGKKPHSARLHRREFLKVIGSGLAAVAALSAAPVSLTSGFFPLPLPVQTAFGSGLLRGTQNGRVFHSADQGQTWQPLMSFGEHCSVCRLVTRKDQVYVQLAVSGYTFWLTSADAKTWHTLNSS